MTELATGSARPGPARILVAEDEEALAMLLEAVLVGAGYSVKMASDGAEAVNQYRAPGAFDLVILDLQMPNLDGRQALARIRELDAAVRAVVLSGEPLDSLEDKPAWAEGFDAYLSKPFDNDELVRLVKGLLGR